MEKIIIKTSSKQYPLYIGQGVSAEILTILKELKLPVSKILVITDDKIASLYLDNLVEKIAEAYDVYTKVIDSGEQAKSFMNYYNCQTAALTYGLDRDSLIIAFGGGVIGDLAGFVAATYMRGIRFIQIPTTILAHDSSVGGKVGINHLLGKNMIGAFHQPEAVVYDISFLASLPETEIRSGFAEIIKHGFIGNKAFYKWLRKNIRTYTDIRSKDLQYMIVNGISVKAKIVAEDEREAGIRALLNFGHTLGHAIEAELGYGKISHGDAVAIGMLYAIKVSEKYFQKSLHYENIKNWFEALTFPTEIPVSLKKEPLINRMKQDKKAKNGIIKMVLMKDIGNLVVKEVDEAFLYSILNKF